MIDVCSPTVHGERQVWLIARNTQGQEVDSLEVIGPNAGREGLQSGVTLGDKELKRMYHASRSFEDTDAIGVDGSIPGHGHVTVRQFTMKVTVQATNNYSWETVERRLWELTSPQRGYGKTGTFFIRYKERDGLAREIEVRRTGTPEPENDTLAGNRAWETWTFEVTAYDPWWYGEDEVTRFVNTDRATSTTLTISNPGDQEGDLIWTFPPSNVYQSWTIPDGLGVYPEGHEKAGERIMMPLPTIAAGETAEADTRPYRLPFRILGKPMSFGLMRQTRFTNPLPPRTFNVELPVSMVTSDDGSVEVRLRPRYERPYA